MADDVRVRLSAEGEAQVVAALRRVASESQRAGRDAARSFGGLNASLGGLRTLLAQVAAAASVGALVAFARSASEAADAVGKMAQSVGASVKNLSALQAVAVTANLKMDQLQAALTIFNRRSTEALAGNDKAQKSFAALGISLDQIRGKDAAERIALVAQALSRIKDSPEKVALGFEFFGRQVGALIPFLNELGEVGLQGAIDRARELGIAFSDDTARAAQALNDDLAILSAQAQALGARFIQGLAPAIVDSLGLAQEGAANLGDVFQDVGRSVGITASLIANTIGSLADRIFTSVSKIINAFAALAAGLLALRHGPIQGAAEAFSILSQATAKNLTLEEEFVARQKERLQLAEQIGFRATEGARALPKLRAGQPELEAPIVPEEKAKRKEKSAEQLAFEAAINAFAAERNQLDFERAQIQAKVSAGVLSEVQANQQLRDLERSRVGALRQLAQAALAAAVALKDPEAIERARELGRAVELMAIQVDAAGETLKRLGATIEDTLVKALTNLFTTGIREAKNFTDVIRNLALAVVDAIQQILAQELAAAAVRAAIRAAAGVAGAFGFAGGGEVRRAEGGPVYGPGSGTSDSIPARLSHGEFVVRAAAVRQPGMLEALSAINAGPSRPAVSPPPGPRRYADGGLVAGAGGGRLDASLTIGLERGLVVRDIESPEGQRAVVRVVARNSRAAGSALGR